MSGFFVIYVYDGDKMATQQIASQCEWISDLTAFVTQSGLIPASAVVAIILFFTKEILESNRKKKAKKNEIDALKQIVARECELNWKLKSEIVEICSYFEPYEDNGQVCPFLLSLELSPSGKTRYYIKGGQEGLNSGLLSEYRTAIIEKHMLDVAKADAIFYQKLESAYETALLLKHLRDSMVDKKQTEEFVKVENIMVGFSGYALAEIKLNNKHLQDLYVYCSGKQLV